MIWIGIAVVLGTFWLIYKNYEARLVLFLSGMLMTLIGISFGGSTIGFPQAIDAFVKQFVNGGLVPTYTTVMGFGYVMSYTSARITWSMHWYVRWQRFPCWSYPGRL